MRVHVDPVTLFLGSGYTFQLGECIGCARQIESVSRVRTNTHRQFLVRQQLAHEGVIVGGALEAFYLAAVPSGFPRVSLAASGASRIA